MLRPDRWSLLIWLLSPLLLAAQDGRSENKGSGFWQGISIVGEYQRGRILPVEPFLRGENHLGRPIVRIGGTSLSVLTAADGTQVWHHYHGMPSTGFGLTLLHFDNPGELGRPVAIHRNFRAPLWRRDVFTIDYGADIGFAGGWRGYSADDNSYNDLISTWLTAYFRLRVGASVRLSDHFRAHADLGLSHVSNGNLKRPNAGLNATSVGIGLQYRPEAPHRPTPVDLPRYQAHNSLSLSAFGAAENKLYHVGELAPEEHYRGVTHGIGGLQASLNRRVSYKSRLGIGVSLFYHAAGNTSVWTESGRLHHRREGAYAHGLRAGVFPAYELVYSRWSVLVQAEYYILAPEGMQDPDRFRQRLGLKYHLTEGVYVAALVNARQFSIADFVEWHVGYTFRQNRPGPESD